MQLSREYTPENHPTCGVHLSNETITEILEFLIPGCIILSITPLEHGKSFNNRIIFIKIEVPYDYLIAGLRNESVNELVLKLNGQFFDLSKSLNEVSCLSLLRALIPEVPSPNVLAWSSTKSSIIHRFTPQGIPERKILQLRSEDLEQHHEWILMTTVPGNPLPNFDLGKEELKTIGRQLADIVFGWRTRLPISATAGNLYCKASNERTQALNCFEIAGLQIAPSSSMAGFDVEVLEPITNMIQYYRLKLETRLRKLQDLDVFKKNAYLIPIIRQFIAARLPQLEICKGEDHFTFTHNDLSPRNILVSLDPTRITGVIDFEFSGFFPELDEFVNDAVCNEGDWPAALYEAYLDRLEECGMKTPRNGVNERLWKEATMLARLEENIAPWWLENISPSDQNDLSEELVRPGKMVLEAIRLLHSAT
ncbi:hypothetical protein N7474_007232 [Penicillium riverlandense]|uniref:uncharacterized protein n=1 Tax=Penicillium riverlandense TaxID=1903569 RepID=UPI0025482678|nr:uncharacterized protein N7474_007232 [Penicillium riverlandense]KAJ5815455.1 hypothetical protein N7474_007232 [Penicillium riverlandense]